ncbi:MAG: MFS transporter, partial [bacterium]|nr:MFS transporter [bacterium]
MILFRNVKSIRLLPGFALLLFVSILFLPTIKIDAQSGSFTPITASWRDNFNLQITSSSDASLNNAVFKSDNHDNNWFFYRVDDPDSCADIINDISWNPAGAGDKVDNPGDDDTTAEYQKRVDSPSGCINEGSKINVNLTNPERAEVSFSWNGEFIQSTDEDAWVFTDDADDTLSQIYLSDESSCRDSIIVSSVGATTGRIVVREPRDKVGEAARDSLKSDAIQNNGNGFAWISLADYAQEENNCMESEEVEVSLTGSEFASAPGTGANSGSGLDGAGSNVDSEPEPSCESNGGALSWIFCPLINLMEGLIDSLDKAIVGFLNFDFNELSDGTGLKESWARIRNLAYILLIPIFLVMVIGTMVGFSFIDAYTVKRSLPRLLAAVLFIALSWDICRIMVDVSNIAGQGMAGLMGGVVGEAGINSLQLDDIFSGAEGALTSYVIAPTGLLLGIGAAIFIGPVATIGIVLSFGLVAFVGLLIGFLLLGFRQVLLLALILVGPLAILSWIFPGNDKLWKLWWNSFSKLLLLFPVIMVLITTGKIFAFIIHEANGAGFIDFSLKWIAYIGPYFLIPATFKLAGSAFANISGMAQNRGRGFFDRQRKMRSGLGSKGAKEGLNRTKGRNFLKGADEGTKKDWLNKKLSTAANMGAIGSSGKLGNWRQDIKAAETTHRRHAGEEAKKDGHFGMALADDAVAGSGTDLLTENYEGIRRWIQSRSGSGWNYNADTGQFEGGDEAKLDAQMGRIQSARAQSIDAGLRSVLTESGAYTPGTNLDNMVSSFMSGVQTYGVEVAADVAHEKAVAGGTYYKNARDEGLATGLVSRGDGSILASASASLRGIAINAGRSDTGSSSFSKRFNLSKELEAAGDDENKKVEIYQKYMEHVADNAPDSTHLHASMKDNSVDNVLAVKARRSKAAAVDRVEAHHAQLEILETAGLAAGAEDSNEYKVAYAAAAATPEYRAAAQNFNDKDREFKLRLSETERAHQAALGSKNTSVKQVADKLMHMDIPTIETVIEENVPVKEKKIVTRNEERDVPVPGLVNPDGTPLMRREVVPVTVEEEIEVIRKVPKRVTTRNLSEPGETKSMLEATQDFKGDKTYQEFHKQWSAIESERERAAAAAGLPPPGGG